MRIQQLLESRVPGKYVYHATFLPKARLVLTSIKSRGLKPSDHGYMGYGVYFAYHPDETYYHVSKHEATMLRVKWDDLVKKFGLYPKVKTGIQRTDDEILVPDYVPSDMIEVEVMDGEWWSVDDAIAYLGAFVK